MAEPSDTYQLQTARAVLYRVIGERLPGGATPWQFIEGLQLVQVLELLASEELRATFTRIADALNGPPAFPDGIYQATVGTLWQDSGGAVVETAQRAAAQLRPLFEGPRLPLSHLVGVVHHLMPIVVANDVPLEWAQRYYESQQ